MGGARDSAVSANALMFFFLRGGGAMKVSWEDMLGSEGESHEGSIGNEDVLDWSYTRQVDLSIHIVIDR